MAKAKESKALTVSSGNSPADMIRMAVEGKADLDKLEKLLTLQERWDANEAKKAYHKAMAEFKANPPKIDKDKKVGYTTQKGNVGYSHASLSNVTDKISTELSKHGLSASWQTNQNGMIIVTCKITHVRGHSESTTISAPADTSGAKNAIQAIGSTITYLERYTLLALTGLATHDMDDDGKAAGKPEVAQPQAKKPDKDIPETEEMNKRAAVIADDFKQSKDLMELEVKGNKYRNEINTKMSKSYNQWLRDQYDSAKKALSNG